MQIYHCEPTRREEQKMKIVLVLLLVLLKFAFDVAVVVVVHLSSDHQIQRGEKKPTNTQIKIATKRVMHIQVSGYRDETISIGFPFCICKRCPFSTFIQTHKHTTVQSGRGMKLSRACIRVKIGKDRETM